MGRSIIKAAVAADGVIVVSGLEHPDAPLIGEDLGALAELDPIGVALAGDPKTALSKARVAIDFTTPAASAALVSEAAAAGVGMVIGVTGFDDQQTEMLIEASKRIPIVKSGNMSLGVNLLTALVEAAAAALPDTYDVEIIEAHHRAKLDAPSGTALMIGAAAASGRGVDVTKKSVHDRTNRREARNRGDIGYAVIRGGGVIGEHEARFLGEKETLVLAHHAHDRALFAEGAIAAARWVENQDPGLYSMRDVLGVNDALPRPAKL